MPDRPPPLPPAPRRPIGIVGDLILDRYVLGAVERISPEAPVPVLRVEAERTSLGGAANVAANVAALGARAALYGLVGDDGAGRELCVALRRARIAPSGVRTDPARPTVVKERFVAGGRQQLLRADRESRAPAGAAAARALRAALARAPRVAAWILSDYLKGTLDAAGVAALVRKARARGIPVVVDPKRADWREFAGATVVCPNRSEAATASRMPTGSIAEAAAAARALTARTRAAILVTLGPDGMWLQDGRAGRQIPALSREVFDPTGAGDTVAAALGVALASGIGLEDAARLANHAAGLSVEHAGTVAIGREELARSLAHDDPAARKSLARPALLRRLRALREQGARIALANGCFDLLHPGHVRLLQHARRQADVLVVAMNSDASVRALKGPGRPVLGERDRAQLLCALDAVDFVTVFPERSVLPLLRAVRPDVLVKGGEYGGGKVVGEEFVRAYGGRVSLVPMLAGRSTTGLLRRAASAPTAKRPPARTGGYVR